MEHTGTQVVVEDTTGMTRLVQRGSSLVELRLYPVHVEDLPWVFPACEKVLQRALDKTDETNAAGIYTMLIERRATLLIEFLDHQPQGCAVTTLVDYPLYRAGEVLLIAGVPHKTVMYPNKDSFELLVEWFRLWATLALEPDKVALLRGLDLACWCPLDQPCHADVLLELANGSSS